MGWGWGWKRCFYGDGSRRGEGDSFPSLEQNVFRRWLWNYITEIENSGSDACYTYGFECLIACLLVLGLWL